jgi:enamine deaminase RidA (YjgF/YER057c/UK114 family)
MNILQPEGWPRPKGYANGISARGRMIFTAGIIGWDENESVVSHVFEDQFDKTLENILAILAMDGAGPEHIVRMTIYVTDKVEYLSRRDELAARWQARLGRHYPAIALVEVKGLLNSAAKVEIEATAVVPD